MEGRGSIWTLNFDPIRLTAAHEEIELWLIIKEDKGSEMGEEEALSVLFKERLRVRVLAELRCSLAEPEEESLLLWPMKETLAALHELTEARELKALAEAL